MCRVGHDKSWRTQEGWKAPHPPACTRSISILESQIWLLSSLIKMILSPYFDICISTLVSFLISLITFAIQIPFSCTYSARSINQPTLVDKYQFFCGHKKTLPQYLYFLETSQLRTHQRAVDPPATLSTSQSQNNKSQPVHWNKCRWNVRHEAVVSGKSPQCIGYIIW